MILQLIKMQENMQYDISKAVDSVTWSGSVLNAGRSVEFALLNDPYDPGLKVPAVCTGDYIALSDGDELFYGQIFNVERSTAIGTITYTAYDIMKNLLESNGRYNFKNLTPEAIAEQVLADIEVPYNHLEPTGITIKSMICDSSPYYDIILGAYTQAYRMTGKRYLPMIWQREFGVWSAVYTVGNFTLSDESNITAASLSESMDGIKNVIKIYDDKGNQVGEVSNVFHLTCLPRKPFVFPRTAALDQCRLLPTPPTYQQILSEHRRFHYSVFQNHTIYYCRCASAQLSSHSRDIPALRRNGHPSHRK